MNEDRSRQRLGRGLASLIGGAEPPAMSRQGAFGGGEGMPATASASGERLVAIGRIVPNPRNPRRNFDAADLAELTASVLAHGVVQPILVRPLPRSADSTAGDFEIVAGERRYRAARAAGLAEIPVVLREIGDRESLEIAIIENVQRADLNAIEEAEAYGMLISGHGYTQANLADVLGKSRSHVANTLRLLKLPEAVREMVVRGDISAGHARSAVSVPDPVDFARQIVEGALTVRQAEDMARGATEDATPTNVYDKPRKEKPSKPAPVRQSKREDTAALERILSEALGMAVTIRLPDEGGDLRIEYGNLERLDEICRLLQARLTDTRPQPRVRSF